MTLRVVMTRGGIAGLVAMALFTAGCGKPTMEVNAGPPNAGFLAQAAEKTRATNTGRFAGDLSFDVSSEFGDGGPSAIKGKATYGGEFALEKEQAHVNAQLTEWSETGPSSSSSSTKTQVGDSFEAVQDGVTLYEKEIAGGQVKLRDGKEWRKKVLQESESNPTSSFFLFSSGSGVMVDPSDVLDQLKAVSDDVSEVGRESVRGIDTTHLHASISFVKLFDQEEAKRAPGTTDPYLTRNTECERNHWKDKSAPVDVFVDDAGLVRRVSSSYSLDDVFTTSCFEFGGTTMQPSSSSSSSSSSDSFRMQQSMTLDFYDFGQAVDIVIPDPSQASEFTPFSPVGEQGSSTTSGTLVHREDGSGTSHSETTVVGGSGPSGTVYRSEGGAGSSGP